MATKSPSELIKSPQIAGRCAQIGQVDKRIEQFELSFRKHQVLKVLNKEDDMNWYRAELDGQEGLIPSNYIEMKSHNWYYGRITRADAEKLLSNKVQV